MEKKKAFKPLTELAAERIKSLKLGQKIEIQTVRERLALLAAVRTLRGAGAIKFRLRTWANSEGTYSGVAVN